MVGRRTHQYIRRPTLRNGNCTVIAERFGPFIDRTTIYSWSVTFFQQEGRISIPIICIAAVWYAAYYYLEGIRRVFRYLNFGIYGIPFRNPALSNRCINQRLLYAATGI